MERLDLMRLLYLMSVWLHVVAATAWIGGMLFLALVVVPWLRKEPGQAGQLLLATGARFRVVGWICLAVFAVTGGFQLYVRGVRFSDFWHVDWRHGWFGHLVLAKLGMFGLILGLSAWHDFWVGPQAAAAMAADAGSMRARRGRKAASRFGRANALLALIMVALGVMLVRGPAW